MTIDKIIEKLEKNMIWVIECKNDLYQLQSIENGNFIGDYFNIEQLENKLEEVERDKMKCEECKEESQNREICIMCGKTICYNCAILEDSFLSFYICPSCKVNP